MKQWYIYMSVRMCVYTLYDIIFSTSWLDWFFVFISIHSKSFDSMNDEAILTLEN